MSPLARRSTVDVRLLTFVNPTGQQFRAATVEEVPQLLPVGGLGGTVDHTWFSGYAWRVLIAPQCKRHMGWRFTRVQTAGPAGPSVETRHPHTSFDLIIFDELSACPESRATILVEEDMPLDATDALGAPVTLVKQNRTHAF